MIHVTQYLQVNFETLDPEAMHSTTMKYAKSVMQLEKGLPPNAVVPKLKEKVEVIRDRVWTNLFLKTFNVVITPNLCSESHLNH